MRLLSALLLLCCYAGSPSPACAADAKPLRTQLTLTHTAPGVWRADYVFAEPVTALELGQQVGPFRSQSWRVLTPGVALLPHGSDEALVVARKPVKAISIDIMSYRPFAEGTYAPINGFSDGGSDFFLGFLYGELKQGARTREMQVDIALRGLAGETVLAPAKPGKELQGYAYFGPSRPLAAGIARTIIDPAAPAWLVEVLQDTTAKVSRFYETAFERPLTSVPLVSVALVGMDGKPGSISIKGGAIGGGVAIRLEGAGLQTDSPVKRQLFAALVAHELAHVWQQNVSRGGVGGTEPWIHEGGAEAIMLEAMRSTAIFTPEQADQAADKLLKECAALKGEVNVYRGFYACGFQRFRENKMPVLALWKAMMARTETTGAVYSSAMIESLTR